MQFGELNYLAIFAATLASFFIGFVWYTWLFSKPWMAAMGLNRDDVDTSGISMGRAIFGSLIASFATALGIAMLFSAINPVSLAAALTFAILVWLAFALGPMFKLIFWEDRPVKLFAIDGGYEFVSILAAALIIIAWP